MMSPVVMREHLLDELVEPVIWGYVPQLMGSGYFPSGLFERLKATFPTLWAASAFKGANGPDQSFLDIGRYVQNNISWLEIARAFFRTEDDRGIGLRSTSVRAHLSPLVSQLGGIIFTGWQRFDHFSVLCELLPVAIPSLVVNLLTVAQGGFSPQDVVSVARSLFGKKGTGLAGERLMLAGAEAEASFAATDLESPDSDAERSGNGAGADMIMALSNGTEGIFDSGQVDCISPKFWMDFEFPGAIVYRCVERLRELRVTRFDALMSSPEVTGWLSAYNRLTGYGSTGMAAKYAHVVGELLDAFLSLGSQLRIELSRIFLAEDTVDEWLFQNVQSYIDRLRSLQTDLTKMLQADIFPAKPLAKPPLSV